MRVLLDSSALVKCYAVEPGRKRVQDILMRADELLLSVLALPEVVAALNRKRREGVLAKNQYAAAKRRVTADVADASVVQLSGDVMAAAVHCLEQAALRASDAIHVASALVARVDCFVSADHRQCDAARALGLDVAPVAVGA